MDFRQLFLRVYIRISSEYDVADAFYELDLLKLLEEVAKVTQTDDRKITLYDAGAKKFYEKRTKRYVVREVNRFIKKIRDVYSDNEDMADFASLRQLNLLIRTFDKKHGKKQERKQISCFALVYIYVMYMLLKNTSEIQCVDYVNALYEIVRRYHVEHPADEVAAFVVGCVEPVVQAIEARNLALNADALPGRPCRHPQNCVAVSSAPTATP